MRLCIFCISIIFPSFIFSQQTISSNILHDGGQRDYILYVPDNYTGEISYPLVFNFHGYTSNANDQMNYGDFRSIADTAGFLVVHPMGLNDNSGTSHFNVGWGGSNVDDLSFVDNLIDSLSSAYNIDQNRIYSTGMSNGGFMSYHLACNLGDRFAAIASVTGTMSPFTFGDCNPSHPTPILEIHGTSDFVVPYNGNIYSTSIDQVMEYWQTYNQCDADPTVTELDDLNTTDGSNVTHYYYGNGAGGSSIELFKINGGAHTWPNPDGFGDVNKDINASEEIWRFFSKYSLDNLITDVKTLASQSIAFTIYPNPSTDVIYINLEETSSEQFQIYNNVGHKIYEAKMDHDHFEINVSVFKEGMYFIKIGNQIRRFIKI